MSLPALRSHRLPAPLYWGREARALRGFRSPSIAVAGHYLIVRAYDYAEASLLAPLAYTEIIMATFAGWWFFGDFPDHWTFLGVGILVACAIYISVGERNRPAIAAAEREFEQP